VIFEELAGLSLPFNIYRIIPLYKKYMRESDNLYDETDHFPKWDEMKQSIQESQHDLLSAIADIALPDKKKRIIFLALASLRRKAFEVLQEKEGWQDNVTYDQAYNHRLQTTGLLGSTFAKILNTACSIPIERRAKIEKGFKHVAMVLQFIDDFIDIAEDSFRDGSLIITTLKENPEEEINLNKAMQEQGTKISIFNLFNMYAPLSLENYFKRMFFELAPINTISPICMKFLESIILKKLPKIKISKMKFFDKLEKA